VSLTVCADRPSAQKRRACNMLDGRVVVLQVVSLIVSLL
jgi:hypothetical protein